MIKNKFGEPIYSESDIVDLMMQGRSVTSLTNLRVDQSVELEKLIGILEDPASLATWTFTHDSDQSVPVWDKVQQQNWYMPEEYKQLDIAEYVLGLCTTQEELQRCGEELLLYQERGLFDLVRYLKYLVDVMQENRVIWGVGRGSSVASYVLYLLGVHRINSMYYDLDPNEFLR
jgi:hypothetical protein